MCNKKYTVLSFGASRAFGAQKNRRPTMQLPARSDSVPIAERFVIDAGVRQGLGAASAPRGGSWSARHLR